MKNLRLAEQKGIAQIFLLVGMLLIAISLPIATKLVQNSQDSRSNAAATCDAGDTKCESGKLYGCNKGTWITSVTCLSKKCNSNGTACAAVAVTTTPTPTKKPTATPTKATAPTKCSDLDESGCKANSGRCFYKDVYVDGPKECRDLISNGNKCFLGGSGNAGWDNSCKSGSCKEGYCVNSYDCYSTIAGKIVANGESVCADNKSYKCVNGSFNNPVDGCGTTTTCATKGGVCVTSGAGMVSGVACKATDYTGVTNLSYTCGGASQVCCIKTTAKVDGKCVIFSNTLTSKPDSVCSSGKIVWVDASGNLGKYRWKCEGSNGGATVECSANAVDDCKRQNGTCMTTCGTSGDLVQVGSEACRPAVCCKPVAAVAKDGVCNTAYTSKTSVSTRPLDADACTAGTVYWTDVSATSGSYKWNCNGLNGGKTASCEVKKASTPSNGGNNPGSGTTPTTAPVPSTGITLSPTSANLIVGGTQQITATMEPSNTTDTVTWSSDNTGVATVSTNGLITAIAPGTATITATTTSGKSKTLVVTVTAAAAGSAQISFKIAFAGIKPGAACISSLGNLNIEVLNTPTNTSQKDLTPVAVKGDDSEVDSKGNQIFYVRNLALDSKFTTLNTANAVKIKGPFHTRRRMCENNQTSKVSESKVCNISLVGTDTYNFSGYTLLAGDLNRDGVINGMDHSVVKKLLNPAAEVQCGREGDLNMDGVVNWLDGNLISDALTSVDDE